MDDPFFPKCNSKRESRQSAGLQARFEGCTGVGNVDNGITRLVRSWQLSTIRMLPSAGLQGVCHDCIGLLRQFAFRVRYEILVAAYGAAAQNIIDQTYARQVLQRRIGAIL